MRWFATTFELTIADVGRDDNAVFVIVCTNGYLKIVKWLARTFAMTVEDARDCRNVALQNACLNRRIDVAEVKEDPRQ